MHHRPISSSTPRTSRRTVLHAALAAPLALGLAGQAAAQSAATAFPSKTIRFVVPYPPGGPTDLMARMLQPELQQRLGVTVIVENQTALTTWVHPTFANSTGVALLSLGGGPTPLLVAMDVWELDDA